MQARTRLIAGLAGVGLAVGIPVSANASGPSADPLAPAPTSTADPSAIGAFSNPFVEPTITLMNGHEVPSAQKCLQDPSVTNASDPPSGENAGA